MRAVVIILHKELRDGLRNRWLWLFAAALGGLALALGGLALADDAGRVGFSRTLAGLINLVLLLTPLMGLALGAQCIAGERERRVLPYLLAQPVGRGQVLLGKYLGLALALGAALGLGFGLAALALAAVDVALYLAVAGLAFLLGLVSLSLGLLVSVLARRMAVAFGVAVFGWFGLVLLADLGLMGTALVLRLRADAVFLLALVNPLQVFKVAALGLVRPSLDVLGPAGLYGTATFGVWLTPLLVGLLLAWALLPLGLALALFARGAEP
jgi:Cu-processing system permease protein